MSDLNRWNWIGPAGAVVLTVLAVAALVTALCGHVRGLTVPAFVVFGAAAVWLWRDIILYL